MRAHRHRAPHEPLMSPRGEDLGGTTDAEPGAAPLAQLEEDPGRSALPRGLVASVNMR